MELQQEMSHKSRLDRTRRKTRRASSHLFGSLDSVTGRISDLLRGLGVDFIIELKPHISRSTLTPSGPVWYYT